MNEKNKCFSFYIYGLTDQFLRIEMSKYISGFEKTKIVNKILKNSFKYLNKNLKFTSDNIYIYSEVNLLGSLSLIEKILI